MLLILGSRSERGGARRAPTKRVQLISDETDVADADADLGDGEEEESAIDDDKTNEDDKDKEGDKPDGPRKYKLTLLNILN